MLDVMTSNDVALSRTAVEGEIDTSASQLKTVAAIEPDVVLRKIRRNRELAASYIEWRRSSVNASQQELLYFLVCLSEIVNFEIGPSEPFRRWSLTGRSYCGHSDVPPEQIVELLTRPFIKTVEYASKLTIEQRIEEVAAIEWTIGIGPVHPFADGCGRTSRYYAVLLSLLYRCPAVVHYSRQRYFEEGVAGQKRFKEYYLSCDRVSIDFQI